VIVRCRGRHADPIKRVIKRVNVKRGNVGSGRRSNEQRSLIRLQTDRMLKGEKRVIYPKSLQEGPPARLAGTSQACSEPRNLSK
jgi:hypothetical protein